MPMNTRMASPQRFMIDNSRPVLVEASLDVADARMR